MPRPDPICPTIMPTVTLMRRIPRLAAHHLWVLRYAIRLFHDSLLIAEMRFYGHSVMATSGRLWTGTQAPRRDVRLSAPSAAASIAAQTASTSAASVASAPMDTRAIQRPSRIAGVR